MFSRVPSKFNTKKQLSFALSLVSVYLILLAFKGFLFASNDLVDVMSYSKYLNNTALYPHDFYVQNIASTLPNERIIFAGLLALMGKSISWMTLLLHVISSLFLFTGIYRIAALFIQSPLLRWISILLLFIPLYGIGPGDCELHYNMFIASLLAKSIGIWALYRLFKADLNWAYILLIPTTFIHPTVGAQLFLLFLGVHIYTMVIHKRKKGLIGIVLFLLCAGVWLILLQLHAFEKEVASTALLFEIFEFRLAHHFFPEYFGLKNVGIGILFALASLYYFIYRKKEIPGVFIALSITGMAIYSLSMSYLPLELILSSQWFKSYIWVEMLAVIALISWIEKPLLRLNIRKWFDQIAIPTLWLTAIILAVMMHIPGNYFSNKSHDLFYQKEMSAEAEIALSAKDKTPNDATFIVPMHFTEFKYFSERSLYIDYKSVVHRKDALPLWYTRIQDVYQIDISDRQEGLELYNQGKINYSTLDLDEIEALKAKGIDYIVTYSTVSYPLDIISSNEEYIIYKL